MLTYAQWYDAHTREMAAENGLLLSEVRSLYPRESFGRKDLYARYVIECIDAGQEVPASVARCWRDRCGREHALWFFNWARADLTEGALRALLPDQSKVPA